MFRNFFIVSLLMFSTSSWSDEPPLSEFTLEPQKLVQHSIERLWISKDAMSCLVQLNSISSLQQSCLSFWKVIEGRRLLFISTRVPFVTDGDSSPVMFATLTGSLLNEIGDTGDYKLYSVPSGAFNWSLSGI